MEPTSFDFSKDYPHTSFHSQYYNSLKRKVARLKITSTKKTIQLETARNFRLAIGLATVICGVIVAAQPNNPQWGLVFIAAIPLFSWAVIKTNRLSNYCKKIQLMLDFYQRQLVKVQGGFVAPHSEVQIKNEKNSDLNIFGSHSIFSQIDETFSIEASQELIQRLNKGLFSNKEIIESHEKIENLNKYFPVARRLLIEGRRASEPILLSDLETIFDQPIITPSYKWNFAAHLILFPTYLIVFFMIGYGKIQAPLALPIVIYAIFSLVSLKSVLAAFRQGEILERSLSGLIPVFQFAEKRKHVFNKELPTLKSKSFSSSLKTLKTYVSFLSIQSHALAYLIVNGLCPWTFIFSGLCEVWRKKNKNDFLKLLKEMSEAEVTASLTTFYHYQSQTLPKFTDAFQMTAEDIYHPLIPRDHVVANDVSLNGNPSMILLTGSNMSGKSTFMRTLAVNQTLALAGAPVFAKSMSTTLAPVISCMQIKDSLEMGYSYFYAEVKKVKEILNQVAKGQRTFFFIDEIFKGTNNKERLIGSKAVIQKLSEFKEARGVVSTHDLELASLVEGRQQVANFHFRDDVSNNTLVFSYKMKPGPCPTTNALKIMFSEGLPVPSHEAP